MINKICKYLLRSFLRGVLRGEGSVFGVCGTLLGCFCYRLACRWRLPTKGETPFFLLLILLLTWPTPLRLLAGSVVGSVFFFEK